MSVVRDDYNELGLRRRAHVIHPSEYADAVFPVVALKLHDRGLPCACETCREKATS